MQNFRKLFDKKIGLIILFVFAFIVPAFSPPPPPPGPTDTISAPIQGGLIYLLALGIGYGIKRIKSIKKEIAE
jgi:hypothetical protein